MKKKIGILVYPDAEVLDFSGPFEVFSVASMLYDHQLFDVFTVAKMKDSVKAVNGLSINPDYDFNTCPQIDVLIISGGDGSRSLINDEETLDWISKTHLLSTYTISICSGARLLGKLGLLDGLPHVTHHLVYDHLEEIAPKGIPMKNHRFVQSDARIFTSGGISAGIDLSFHLLGILAGKEVKQATAEYMEYRLIEEASNLR